MIYLNDVWGCIWNPSLGDRLQETCFPTRKHGSAMTWRWKTQHWYIIFLGEATGFPHFFVCLPQGSPGYIHSSTNSFFFPEDHTFGTAQASTWSDLAGDRLNAFGNRLIIESWLIRLIPSCHPPNIQYISVASKYIPNISQIFIDSSRTKSSFLGEVFDFFRSDGKGWPARIPIYFDDLPIKKRNMCSGLSIAMVDEIWLILKGNSLSHQYFMMLHGAAVYLHDYISVSFVWLKVGKHTLHYIYVDIYI